MTFPYSSIVMRTTTIPATPAALAAGGYSGGGRLIALPFSTPPAIGPRFLGLGGSLDSPGPTAGGVSAAVASASAGGVLTSVFGVCVGWAGGCAATAAGGAILSGIKNELKNWSCSSSSFLLLKKTTA